VNVFTASLAAVFVFSSCSPNRTQSMAKAARDQATAATGDMGTPDQVRIQAKEEVILLNGVSTTIYSNLDKYSVQERATYIPLAQSTTAVASGLQAIAVSQTDTGFTSAIFAMCDPDRRAAEPRVGQMELAMAGALQAGKLQPKATPQERANAVAMLTAFGNTMVSIPGRCEQANNAMAEASVQEQNAEAQHQANVSRALTAAAIIFVGTAMVAGEVGAAAATRPPVQQNYLYVNQYNSYGY
jgi:hypothetical protein